MDKLIARFDAEHDRDLNICERWGVAYQRDMRVTAKYDENYFNKCLGYEGQEIALKINAGRTDLVDRYMPTQPVLDIGIGSGEFIRTRPNTWGYDINPKAIRWLRANSKWSEDLRRFNAFTCWDVLEHVPAPEVYFKRMAAGSHVFASIPIFNDLRRIRESKHYRPGEHLYYWTQEGFTNWMARYGFKLLEVADFETAAGRESILSFAFSKTLPDYHETLQQYREMHSHFYGASAWLYLEQIAHQVRELNPQSILDYGCGRSDLVAHFWKDGARRIEKYDAAIPIYETMPKGRFDLVICCDVMEHVLMADVDQVLREIKAKSGRALFTISMKPAKAKLPDGRNAHVTLLSDSEWTRWVASVFGQAVRLPTQWDHILMLRTW